MGVLDEPHELDAQVSTLLFLSLFLESPFPPSLFSLVGWFSAVVPSLLLGHGAGPGWALTFLGSGQAQQFEQHK